MAISSPLQVENLVGCPICGEPRAELVLQQPDSYLPELHLQRCRGCGIVYLNPRLTFAAVVAVESVSEVYSFSQAEAEEKITKTLTGIVDYLGRFATGKERRLLDIGCNRGLMLEAGRRLGWQVTGVEISPVAAAHARADYGLTIYPTVEALPAQSQFDLIVAWHVLEHTLAPLDFLRQAAERLAPGGAIALQVPSFDYLTEYQQRNQLGSLVCSVHNFYFTLESLRTVVQQAGLTPLQLGNDPNHLFLTAVCTKPNPTLRWWQKGLQLIGFNL